MNPKIAILGYGRAGKDTASEYLASTTPLRYAGSTSEFALGYVAGKLGLTPEEAFARRHESDEMRKFWYDSCNELRAGDPTVLVRRVLEAGDIVCGLRDAEEVRRLPELGVAIRVWIHRDVPRDPTVMFGPEDCDVVVYNTHPTDPRPMFGRLAALVRAMGVPCSHGASTVNGLQ